MKAEQCEGIPQPPGNHWFLGHLPEMKKHLPHLWDWYVEIAEKYGGQSGVGVTGANRPPMVILTDPKNIEHVMKTNFNNYVKRHPRLAHLRTLGEFFGDGIFSVDGNEWHEQRKLYSYAFSMKNLRNHMFPDFERITDRLVAKIDQFAESGEKFDIQYYFGCMTVESICSIAFGQDLGYIEAEGHHPFVKAFDMAQLYSVERARDPLWRIKRFFSIGERETKLKEHIQTLHDFCMGLIKKIRAGDFDETRFNIVKLAIDRAAENGGEISDEALKALVMSFLIAGRDTTACAMSWTTYELCQNPDVLDKVLKEIGGLEKIDFINISNNTDYLKSVFLETLRLHPSVPADQKAALKDDILPSGLKVKSGWLMGFHPYVAGRNRRVWGDDVLEFKPDRFRNGDKQYGEYVYPVFNVGDRLCLGKTMAILESRYVLARLFQRYEFDLVPEHLPVQYVISLLLWIKGGLQVTVKFRKQPTISESEVL